MNGKAYLNLAKLIQEAMPIAGFDFAGGVGTIKLCGYDSDVIVKYKLLRDRRTGRFAYKIVGVVKQPRLFSPSIPFASERDKLLWHLHKNHNIPLPLRLEKAVRRDGSLTEVFKYTEGRVIVWYRVENGKYEVAGYKLIQNTNKTE